MSHFVPASTHAVESTVVDAPIDVVWAAISNLQFDWWNLIENAALKHGSSTQSIGAVMVTS
jgi:hypothetical protein